MAKTRKPKPYKTNRSNKVKRLKAIKETQAFINKLLNDLKVK